MNAFKPGTRTWRAIGWLISPLPFAVLCGLVSLALSYTFDWARGWELVWSFVVPAVTVSAIEGANRMFDRRGRRHD